MTALEKLNALQAGNIDKVLVSFGYHPRDFDLARDAYNAAKVEVTKVVLPELIYALNQANDFMRAHFDSIGAHRQDTIGYALTTANKLKESL